MWRSFNAVLKRSNNTIVCTIIDSDTLDCDGEYWTPSEFQGGMDWGFLFGYIAICVALVLFAGLMSGLTLGLLSLDPIHLQIWRNSGEPSQREYAKKIIPLLKSRHLVLVTLLICNSAAMEALPIFLDKIVPSEWIAILISVTAVLLFGEIIPQAICSRFGLAIGAHTVWVVKALIVVTFIITWPISKALDFLLGAESPYYHRNELKELVSIHIQQTKEREDDEKLNVDEITMIKGVLDGTAKTVKDAMTPLRSVYMLDIDTKLTTEALTEIYKKAYSRVPVYEGNHQHVVGQLLVKRLILVDPNQHLSVRDIPLRRIPSVASDSSLYDILNMFQSKEGRSHIATVYDGEHNNEARPIIGIITLEDVLEELIQEKIGEDLQDEARLSLSKSITKLRNSLHVYHSFHSSAEKSNTLPSNTATQAQPPSTLPSNSNNNNADSQPSNSSTTDNNIGLQKEDISPSKTLARKHSQNFLRDSLSQSQPPPQESEKEKLIQQDS